MSRKNRGQRPGGAAQAGYRRGTDQARGDAPDAEAPVGDLVGTEVEVDVEAIAHGGHCVARADGQVLFVRHALPGERVRARVTKGAAGDRYLFADAVEILRASADRVAAPCRYAGPGGCGGCDFQHVALAAQRQLKAAVVAEQLRRLGGIDWPVDAEFDVESVPGDEDGLRWRTRLSLAVDRRGVVGLHPHRSRTVLDIDDCLIARRELIDTGVLTRRRPRARQLDVVFSSTGERAIIEVPAGLTATPTIHERVETPGWRAEFALNARSFWQVHPGAAAVLVERVLAELDPQPQERALDLYAGVGLFARALADRVGPDGAVLAVESDRRAVEAARAWAQGRDEVEVREERVDRALQPLLDGGDRVDLAVLDPPRAGAGERVIRDLLALRPRAVAYVACDPAALARDLRHAAEGGYRLAGLAAYDLFPMTHHVECVATLMPGEPPTDLGELSGS